MLTLLFLLSLLSLVAADFSLSSMGSTISASSSTAIPIPFEDDGNSPKFGEISSTKVLLCTGPNTDVNCLATVLTFTPTASQKSVNLNLVPYLSLGSNGPYYFQFYSIVTAGGFTIHYSPRVLLTGMTGTLQATDGGDTSPPDSQVDVVGTGVDSGVLTKAQVPYTAQTGRTRYAPMQMQPPTKVTHQLKATRRLPTSSVSFFSVYMSKPYIVTTVTPSWSYTILQGPNWIPTQSQPTGYYAASEALKRNINAKSRRGYLDL
jgi:hypothetical protein